MIEKGVTKKDFETQLEIIVEEASPIIKSTVSKVIQFLAEEGVLDTKKFIKLANEKGGVGEFIVFQTESIKAEIKKTPRT